MSVPCDVIRVTFDILTDLNQNTSFSSPVGYIAKHFCSRGRDNNRVWRNVMFNALATVSRVGWKLGLLYIFAHSLFTKFHTLIVISLLLMVISRQLVSQIQSNCVWWSANIFFPSPDRAFWVQICPTVRTQWITPLNLWSAVKRACLDQSLGLSFVYCIVPLGHV